MSGPKFALTAIPGPPARISTTQHVVSCLPEDSPNHYDWSITVEYRGEGRWAVLLRGGRQCLGRDGEWSYESVPSEREDAWIAEHRFSEQEALRLAVQWAPKIVCNGKTAAEVLAWEAGHSAALATGGTP